MRIRRERREVQAWWRFRTMSERSRTRGASSERIGKKAPRAVNRAVQQKTHESCGLGDLDRR
jgi:hypothetical protein